MKSDYSYPPDHPFDETAMWAAVLNYEHSGLAITTFQKLTMAIGAAVASMKERGKGYCS